MAQCERRDRVNQPSLPPNEQQKSHNEEQMIGARQNMLSDQPDLIHCHDGSGAFLGYGKVGLGGGEHRLMKNATGESDAQ